MVGVDPVRSIIRSWFDPVDQAGEVDDESDYDYDPEEDDYDLQDIPSDVEVDPSEIEGLSDDDAQYV